MIPTPAQTSGKAGAAGSAPSRHTAIDANDQYVWALNDGAVGSAAPSSYANTGALGATGNAMAPLSGSVFRTSPGMFGTAPNSSTAFNTYGTGCLIGPTGTAGNIANPITVSCWMYFEVNNGSMHLVGRSHDTTNDAGNESVFLSFNATGPYGSLWLPGGNTIVQASNGPYIGNVSYGGFMWHHTGMTYDGTTMKIYVDGDQVGSTAATGAIQYVGANPWWVYCRRAAGDTTFPASEAFTGRICDVRIANVARSASWFQSVFQTGVGLY